METLQKQAGLIILGLLIYCAGFGQVNQEKFLISTQDSSNFKTFGDLGSYFLNKEMNNIDPRIMEVTPIGIWPSNRERNNPEARRVEIRFTTR